MREEILQALQRRAADAHPQVPWDAIVGFRNVPGARLPGHQARGGWEIAERDLPVSHAERGVAQERTKRELVPTRRTK